MTFSLRPAHPSRGFRLHFSSFFDMTKSDPGTVPGTGTGTSNPGEIIILLTVQYFLLFGLCSRGLQSTVFTSDTTTGRYCSTNGSD